jgi:hypothetical protein
VLDDGVELAGVRGVRVGGDEVESRERRLRAVVRGVQRSGRLLRLARRLARPEADSLGVAQEGGVGRIAAAALLLDVAVELVARVLAPLGALLLRARTRGQDEEERRAKAMVHG